MARRIHMGTLARPHGIKGEICVDWYADSPSLLDGPFWLHRRVLPGPVPGACTRAAPCSCWKA